MPETNGVEPDVEEEVDEAEQVESAEDEHW